MCNQLRKVRSLAKYTLGSILPPSLSSSVEVPQQHFRAPVHCHRGMRWHRGRQGVEEGAPGCCWPWPRIALSAIDAMQLLGSLARSS